MTSTRYTKQKFLNPSDFGLDNADMDVILTSNWIGTAGFDQMTLFFDWTVGSGTVVAMQFEAALVGDRPKQQPTPMPSPIGTPHKIQIQDPPQGNPPTAMLNNFRLEKDADGNPTAWVVNLPINYELFRIVEIETTGPAPATDFLTVRGVMSYLG